MLLLSLEWLRNVSCWEVGSGGGKGDTEMEETVAECA